GGDGLGRPEASLAHRRRGEGDAAKDGQALLLHAAQAAVAGRYGRLHCSVSCLVSYVSAQSIMPGFWQGARQPRRITGSAAWRWYGWRLWPPFGEAPPSLAGKGVGGLGCSDSTARFVEPIGGEVEALLRRGGDHLLRRQIGIPGQGGAIRAVFGV